MDIQNAKEKDANDSMDWNEIFGQDNEDHEEEIYCNKCLKIPAYSIIITKDKIIQLSHICKGKEEEIYFPFENKSHSYPVLECYYCKKTTSDVCLECKKYICKMCQNEHILKPNDQDDIPWISNRS